MSRGVFIAFEGGEGSGKSTQIEKLAPMLEEQGIDPVRTREPGGTPAAEAIRALLVTGDTNRWAETSELLLMMAARAEHITQLIAPTLASGRWVLCDRFVASSIAYQGYARGLGGERVRSLHEAAFGPLYPDLTLLLDLPVEAGLARAGRRAGGEDRFERFNIDFHERVRQGYLALAAERREAVAVIDAGRDIDAVASTVWQAVSRRFLGPAR